MCADRVHPERPEHLVRLDAACTSRRRFFFLMNKCLITDSKRNIVVSGTKNARLFQVDNDSVALLSSHELAPAAPHSRSGAHVLAPGAHHGQSGAHILAPGTPYGQRGAHDLAPGTPHGQSGANDLALATQPGRSSPQKRLSLQDSQLWHRCLAHPNHTAMESLVDGYTYDDRICETYVLAKYELKIIRILVQYTTTPFELVHSNTCGPFATKSIGGATHFIVFINDFSRYAYVYPLLNKLAGTCTGIFQLFQKKVENWGYTIKRFRCDNGRGEYNNRLFRGILVAGGISFELAPPYTQHKNGVAEQTIGVLTRKARSLLLDS